MAAAEAAEARDAPPARGARTEEEEVEHEALASSREIADVERAAASPFAREVIESGVVVVRGWDIHPDDVESGAPGKLASDMSPDDLE